MTSHQIAIAKASFSAGLLRPDPTSVPRDEITSFHSALDRALAHCSPSNIQTCKSWLLKNVIPSPNRIGVLGKYLTTLAGSLGDEGGDNQRGAADAVATASGENGTPQTSAKRKKLHILYLLNDLLHHTKYHGETTTAFSTLSGSLQPYLVELVGLAAGYSRTKNPKYHKRLSDLLDIWASNGYYSTEYIRKLHETVGNYSSPDAIKTKAAGKDETPEAEKQTAARDVPYVMPATHGDPVAPYHELPAGNFIPHIIPNSLAPIRPQAVKPLQFLAGPADQNLVNAVKQFLKDANRIYISEPPIDEGTVSDIDELGHVVVRDELTGDILDGESYYGWSRSFCEKMKKRREGKAGSRSPSRSQSRSHSFSPRKRRRYSDSISSDDRGRSRSRSSSVSHRNRRRSYSRSASRSRTPPRRSMHSRSQSYSPRPLSPLRSQQHQPPHHPHDAAPPVPPPPPPMQYPFNHGPQQFNPPQPGGPGGMFISPPPRPPNWHGPWPPPHPPHQQHQQHPGGPPPPPPPFPPAMNMGVPGGMNMNMNMNMNIPGFPPHFNQSQSHGGQFAPPPPPPPASHLGPPHAQNPQPLQPGTYHFPPPHPGQGRGQPYYSGHEGGSGRGGGRGGWGRGEWH
ncbi:hypothetical protein AJ80_01073 [Polytolypa hystricis UAMH7299]|uniref:CID domain-containing protein n=1 Tax=Polytolypa hystricis (strain UAMH7299) TaxID=1447883 RepID=A0A2B7Z2R0_POLH7|nr:hypothetical protein AJ80_01073 [Polytolypa hystricis UAMH7299]